MGGSESDNKYFSRGALKSSEGVKDAPKTKILLSGRHLLPSEFMESSRLAKTGVKGTLESVKELDDEQPNKRNMVSTSRKGETPEEKKIRKAKVWVTYYSVILFSKILAIFYIQVKEDRRQHRLGKKQLKEAYKNEDCRQIKQIAKQQDVDGVSVFKYT
jgi:hypothetical protein